MPEFKIHSLSDLPALAKQLIAVFGDRKTIAFSGPMGAGKTTLIKAICLELGVKENISSPTFSIVNEYTAASGKLIYHFDFYRIKDLNEAYDMGYEEYFYSGAWCFIEWPEKIEGLLPENSLRVEIAVNDGARTVNII